MEMTEEKVLQQLIDNEMEKGQSWSKLDIATMARAFPYMDNYSDKRAEKLKTIAKHPNKIFDGETWKRLCNVLDNKTIYDAIKNFYSNKYESTLEGYRQINELESIRPVFLIVHSKKLKEDKLYTIKYKAKGHGTCIFIIINEFIEGKMI